MEETRFLLIIGLRNVKIYHWITQIMCDLQLRDKFTASTVRNT